MRKLVIADKNGVYSFGFYEKQNGAYCAIYTFIIIWYELLNVRAMRLPFREIATAPQSGASQ